MTTDKALEILGMPEQARWREGYEGEDVKKAVETIRKALQSKPSADVLDKMRDKIMQLDYDIESVNYDYDDMSCTEEVHMICREEVVRIIDEYKAESEGTHE